HKTLSPTAWFANQDSLARSHGETTICVGPHFKPSDIERRQKIRLSRAASLVAEYQETRIEPSSSSTTEDPCCIGIAASVETMLPVKICARAMEDTAKARAAELRARWRSLNVLLMSVVV